MKSLLKATAVMLLCSALAVPSLEAQGRGNRPTGNGGGRSTSSSTVSNGGGRGSVVSTPAANPSASRPQQPSVQRPQQTTRPAQQASPNLQGGRRPDGALNGSNGGGRPAGIEVTTRPSGSQPSHGQQPGNVGGQRPDQGGNNFGSQQPGHGSQQPGNAGNGGNNGGQRPGAGTRPGNAGLAGRPNGNPNMGHPDHGHVGGPSAGPAHPSTPGYRPGIHPGVRPMPNTPPPAWRPMPPAPWVRPLPPHGWRPGPLYPTFSTILGITFGTALNATLNALLTGGYSVYSYGHNEIYLNNINQLNLFWPDATLFYTSGRLTRGDFIYSTDYYDTARYNIAYSRLVANFGNPISTTYPANGMQTTWYGYDGRFVTLTYQPMYSAGGYLRYYTTLSFGM